MTKDIYADVIVNISVDSLDKAGFKANAAGLGWYLKIKGN